MRTSKNFGTYKYDYIYDGDKLIAELKTDPTNGNYQDRKEYFYDGNDEVIGFTRRNGQDTYFYLKDAEGNIIGFTDGNGSVQGLYDYDAWGKVSHRYSASWENPLTYRGYYYDDENMVYYLQSRYYNPQWGRFLNADIPEIAQQCKNEINGLNLFAYCCNDPVNNSDPSGYSSVASPSEYNDIFRQIISAFGGFGVMASAGMLTLLPAIAIIALVVLLISIPSSTDSNIANTRTLKDTRLEKRSGKKEYQFCYFLGNKKCTVGGKKTLIETLIILGISNPVTDFSRTYKLKYKKLKGLAKKTYNKNQYVWGVFADSKEAAKALAVILGYNAPPEIHKSGYYAHYHDRKHMIHIWYGTPYYYN